MKDSSMIGTVPDTRTVKQVKGVMRRYMGLLILAVILAIIPWFLPNSFYFDIVIRIAINAIVVIGLNLLMGYTGQLSLGHAAFFGIGAYSSAILTTQYAWHGMLAMLCGIVVTGLLAFIVARPILKLKGNTLAMATLGLGIIISIAITNEAQLTGGPDGISVGSLALFGWDVSGDKVWYGIVAVVLLLITLGAKNLIDSPSGISLQAIHGSEIAARVAGVNVTGFKVRIFVLSAMVASFAGSLYAHYVCFITPGIAGFFHSIELVTMVIVGCMASIFGSIVGAALLTLLPQLLATFEGWETVVYGLILMVTMIFMPKGLVPTLLRRFGKGGR